MFKFKKKEKEPIIVKRIKAIYNKLKIMYEGEHPNVFHFMDVNGYGGLYYYGYTIKTKSGIRKILVNSDYSLFYGDKNLWKKKSYIPLPGESSYSISGMFAISTYRKIDIILKPGLELTPEEMDANITEFERAISPDFRQKLLKENKQMKCEGRDCNYCCFAPTCPSSDYNEEKRQRQKEYLIIGVLGCMAGIAINSFIPFRKGLKLGLRFLMQNLLK